MQNVDPPHVTPVGIKLSALTVILLFMIVAGLFLIIKREQKKQLQQSNNFFVDSQNRPKPSPKVESQKVADIFTNKIPNLDGHWAVAVKDLKTGKTYTHGESDIFPSASIYKLTVMWAVFDAIEKGHLERTDALNSQLSAMITVSDNDSAVALSETLGWENIEKLMKREGFSGFDLTGEGSPYTNADSTMKLLESIYKNTAVSPDASNRMKTLLFAQQINDRIPALLPNNVKVAHKTGEIDNLRHDAGIVLGKKSHYIFVFLTDTPVPQNATETIAQLSKQLYGALEQN